MSFLPFESLKEKIEKRDIRKAKLKEALAMEYIMESEDYKKEDDKPLNFNRSDVARKLVSRIKAGDSIVVNTKNMVREMRIAAKKIDKYVMEKKIDDGKYRVWII